MGKLPPGVCIKNGYVYRRFKVREDGRWIDFYVKLPPLDSPHFGICLDYANQQAEAGEYTGRSIRVQR